MGFDLVSSCSIFTNLIQWNISHLKDSTHIIFVQFILEVIVFCMSVGPKISSNLIRLNSSHLKDSTHIFLFRLFSEVIVFCMTVGLKISSVSFCLSFF